MFTIYFGEWKSGRLQRLSYLGYDLLSMFLLIVAGMGIAFALGFLNKGEIGLESLNELGTSSTGIVMSIIFVILFLAMIVAQFNIFAKRIRDMGLPALWTIVAIIIISIIINVLYPPQEVAVTSAIVEQANSTMASTQASVQNSAEATIFTVIISLLTLLIPSDTFKRN